MLNLNTVDSIGKKWLRQPKFDLIHLRYLLGSFIEKQWRGVYEQAYNQPALGVWSEQVECGLDFFSDDGTMPADSKLADASLLPLIFLSS